MTHTSISRHRVRGFTMLELMMAMTIFSMLGLVVVMLMRQGMTIFVNGSQGSVLQDRMDTVVPQVERKLMVLAIPASFEPPPPPPSEEELLAGQEYTPPPPVQDRLRAVSFKLRDVPEGPLKGIKVSYAAWVVDAAGSQSNEFLREAGDRTGPDLLDVTPAETDAPAPGAAYKASGGRMEICYVAVPTDPDFPALLTLYEGYRAPVGGPNTLLDELNLDTMVEIRKHCREIATGLLYFGILWRRVFVPPAQKGEDATRLLERSWRPSVGRVGETDPYVGWRWDSTRGLDREFGLYRGELSLGDPSDDIFPAWARVEIALVGPTNLGMGRGETSLLDSVSDDEGSIFIADTSALSKGGQGDDRFLKIDGEWMSYRVSRIDPVSGRVHVQRGVRNTVAAPHEYDADVYVGLYTRRDLRLVFRDRYARGRGEGK